jgi:hypothetical protein
MKAMRIAEAVQKNDYRSLIKATKGDTGYDVIVRIIVCRMLRKCREDYLRRVDKAQGVKNTRIEIKEVGRMLCMHDGDEEGGEGDGYRDMIDKVRQVCENVGLVVEEVCGEEEMKRLEVVFKNPERPIFDGRGGGGVDNDDTSNNSNNNISNTRDKAGHRDDDFVLQPHGVRRQTMRRDCDGIEVFEDGWMRWLLWDGVDV